MTKKLQWRNQPDMNPYNCKTGCCATTFRVCFQRYQCKCHQTIDVSEQ